MKFNQPVIIGAVVVAALLAGAGAASVTISEQSPNPLAPAQGTLNESTHLSVTDVNMTYKGLYATGVSIGVTNEDTTADHTGNVSIAVANSTTNTIFESANKTNVNFPGNSTETKVKVSFNSNVRVNEFDVINVNVEELS